MQPPADHTVTTSIAVEIIKQTPAIIGAIFAGVAMIMGIRNGAKASEIKTLVDGHASAAAAQLSKLHDEVVTIQDKRIEDVKQAASQTASDVKAAIQSAASTVSAAVATDPSKPLPVVVVDRRKDIP